MSETSIAVQRPMELMAQAVLSGDVKIEVVRELAQMHREEREHQSMVDFNEAMHRAQSKMRRILAWMLRILRLAASMPTYAKQAGQGSAACLLGGGLLAFVQYGRLLRYLSNVRVQCCDVSRGGYVQNLSG